MSKLFNQKRIESIKANNFLRYFAYAIGEVIIIVIGVFVAIYFNDLQTKKTKRKYLEEVVNNIEAESNSYIRRSHYFIDYNVKRDALAQKIFDNTVRLEDYEINGNDYIYILRSIVEINFDVSSLGSLKDNIDHLNEDEKQLLSDLSFLNANQEASQAISENVNLILNDYKRFEKANLDWYYQALTDDSVAVNKELAYRLGSMDYKNFVADLARFEIDSKSGMYSLFQCLSFKILFNIYDARNTEKLAPAGMDSIFDVHKLKKLDKMMCDTTIPLLKVDDKIFNGTSMYGYIYNASNDTIEIKNEHKQISVGNLPPKHFIIRALPVGTALGVYVGGACITKYKTHVNSYLFYE